MFEDELLNNKKLLKPIIINTPGPQPGWEDIRRYDKRRTLEIVKQNVKKNKYIVHGARAINIQVTEPYKRPTLDYDVFAKNTRNQAVKLERILDKAFGSDMFYVSGIQITGKNEIVFRVISVADQESVADFTITPKGVKYVTIDGIRYVSLAYAKMVCKEVMSNPLKRHRWDKAAYDLQRIESYEHSLKGGEKDRRNILHQMWGNFNWYRMPMSQMRW